MSRPYFTPLRCTAEIPVSPYDGVVCGALADVILEEGARCQSCADEFGGTPLGDNEPETITPEQLYKDERFEVPYLLEISTPCHKRNGAA